MKCRQSSQAGTSLRVGRAALLGSVTDTPLFSVAIIIIISHAKSIGVILTFIYTRDEIERTCHG